jgi:hypothetical protein
MPQRRLPGKPKQAQLSGFVKTPALPSRSASCIPAATGTAGPQQPQTNRQSVSCANLQSAQAILPDSNSSSLTKATAPVPVSQALGTIAGTATPARMPLMFTAHAGASSQPPATLPPQQRPQEPQRTIVMTSGEAAMIARPHGMGSTASATKASEPACASQRDAAARWKEIQGRFQPVKCKGHNEHCVMRQVCIADRLACQASLLHSESVGDRCALCS